MIQVPMLPRVGPGARLCTLLVLMGVLGMMIEAVPDPAPEGARPWMAWVPRLARVDGVRVAPSWDRAIVTWNTSVPTDTVIEFQGNHTLGQTTSLAQGSTIRHALVLRGLHSGETYTYSIVGRDRSGSPFRAGPFRFTTPEGGPPSGSGGRAPAAAAWDGCCRMQRMTPDEREKLRASIRRFTDPKREVTAAEKRQLLETRTSPAKDDEFNNRLQLVRSWLISLRTSGRQVEKWDNQPKLLQTLFYTNKVQAAKKLDRFARELDALERGR